MKKCVVIYNPHSGKNMHDNFILDFIKVLNGYGYDVDFIYTEYKYHAFKIIDDINDKADSMYLKINKSASIKQPFEVYKIMPNGDLEGYIIFDFKYSTTEKDKVLVDFLILFLNNYFESNWCKVLSNFVIICKYSLLLVIICVIF